MGKRIRRPLGARIIVDEIITSMSITDRANRAGLVAITEESNRPDCTQGKVLAVGNDPIFQELGWTPEAIKRGIEVSFGRLSGTHIYIEGEHYRSLEFQEIIDYTMEEEDDSSTSVGGIDVAGLPPKDHTDGDTKIITDTLAGAEARAIQDRTNTR